MPRSAYLPVSIICALAGAGAAFAQPGVGDWTTTGFDAQRSFWVRNDAKISLETMRKPGFALVWKTDVNQAARQKSFVTAPVLLDFYIGYRGFRSLSFTGSGANAIVAMDTDLGRLEWRKDFDGPAGATSSPLCPGGMTSGLARPTEIAYPPSTGGRGRGRGSPAKSGVGEPFEGAVVLKELASRQPARPAAPPPSSTNSKGGRRSPALVNPYAPRIQWLYALPSDGKLRSLYVSNGDQPKDSISFLPANAYAKGLLVADGVAYVATTNKCGGVDNGVWALDLESSQVSRWKASKNVAGLAGLAVGPDGTIYAAAGNELAALEERRLKRKDSYKIGDHEFTSSPVVFDFKGKDLVAATSDDGRLHLLDAAAIDQPLTTSAAFSAPGFATGAIASWEDKEGTRWLLAPAGGAAATKAGFDGDVTSGAIVAWKVVDNNGKPALQPGWISRDMISPLTPIVVNGVVFAVSSGEYRGGSEAEKLKNSRRAILYALDSGTGKELWNSGETLTSFVTTGGLAAGGSRVYVATEDGMQYVFGFPIEH